MLLDYSGISRLHNTLFQSSPCLWFIVRFRDDFVSRDDPLVGKEIFMRAENLTKCFESLPKLRAKVEIRQYFTESSVHSIQILSLNSKII